jgi:hypothetical protein
VIDYTIRRNRFYYRRGPNAHWVQTREHATGFRTERLAWDEGFAQGLDEHEVLVEPRYHRAEGTTLP